jgi:uncharacterized protein (TIGR02001 family)
VLRYRGRDFSNAVLEARSGGCEIVRLLAPVAALLVGMTLASSQLKAANQLGGSVALSSDYYVRGISRTDDRAALQLDLHYSSPSGFFAGAFASNSQYAPSEQRDVELSGFIGYAWNVSDEWRAKIFANHYAYPWNHAGAHAHYNYDELDFDLAYQGWLHLSVGYSPNSPRYLAAPYRTHINVTEKSAEVSLQRQVFGKFSFTAGVGYSFLEGPESGGYAYWSGGAAYDYRSLILAVSYVNSTAEAKALFYSAAATGEWTGTVIWRF